jgi:glycine hydroxymethyltransferase
MKNAPTAKLAINGIEMLAQEDPDLYQLIVQEYNQQIHSLTMVAASGIATPSVLICQGSVLSNVTTEGYPENRFHGGCQIVDQIELLAINRAKKIFGARYANVQPHSGTSANEIVLFSVLKPGDVILGMSLDCGGHLTHGSTASISGNCFRAIGYGLDASGLIDYEQVRALSREFKPRLIIAGASSYPRRIDFNEFRRIADEVGAYLLADISHIAGLVVAGQHPNPVDSAHFTTTSTYKQLGGPRGGLILMGKDFDQPSANRKTTLAESIQRTVFPYFQGTPNLSAIAAKARAFAMADTFEFKQWAQGVVRNAAALAANLRNRGYSLLTGGSDNHMVLLNIGQRGITGVVAEKSLGECNIIVNKNRIPNDQKDVTVTSGLRLGTNILTARGMQEEQMAVCADLLDEVLSSITMSNDRAYCLDAKIRRAVTGRVADLCDLFPIANYPTNEKPRPETAAQA